MVITLSRQAESGGDEVAELIASKTGMRIADRLILEQMAQRSGLPVTYMELFDETLPGPIESLVVEWHTSVNQAVYMRRLIHTLLLLEQEGNVILVGRGGAFVLNDPGTFHLRIIAPLPCRIARLMEKQSISSVQAERILLRADDDRQRFLQSIFGADVNNPSHYDMVLNTAEIMFEDAAEIIIIAAQRKEDRRQQFATTAEDIITRTQRLRQRPHQPRVSEVVWQFCQRRPHRM